MVQAGNGTKRKRQGKASNVPGLKVSHRVTVGGRKSNRATKGTRNMLRWIVIILATVAALSILIVLGVPLPRQAFNVGGFGVTWTMLAGFGLLVLFAKFSKG
jgi:hypothetical protein